MVYTLKGLGSVIVRPGTGRHDSNVVTLLSEISRQRDDLAITGRIRGEVFVTEY
jgi:hypothetical protein